MKVQNEHLFPRELTSEAIREYFFPDIQEIDLRLKTTFYKQATVSLFLVISTVAALSAVMFIFSLISNIDTFELARTLLIIFAVFAFVIVARKIFTHELGDYRFLIFIVFFIASWGVAKDVSNFGVVYNAYGWMFVAVVFFGLVFMPFMPKFSLYLAAYCAILYLALWILFVVPIIQPETFAGSAIGDWIAGLLSNIQSGKSDMEHYRFYAATHFIQYGLFGCLAFVFRAANLRSYIKAFQTDKRLQTQEVELNAARALLSKPESQHLEFKSSARWDYREGKTSKILEKVIVKTIAGFMNSDGGILFIGVDDDGNAVGLEKDYHSFSRKNSDGYQAFIVRLVSAYLGRENCEIVIINFHTIDDKEVCSITVKPSESPVFVEKMEGALYVRTGNSTQELNTKEALEYVGRHFERDR